MNFCNKCEKETLTKIIGNKEECMVCGAEIISKSQKSAKFINSLTMKTVKDYKEITKTNKNTGQYENAQNVGRNVLIGIIIIIIGILYSFGGIDLVIKAIIIGIIALVALAVMLFMVAMASD